MALHSCCPRIMTLAMTGTDSIIDLVRDAAGGQTALRISGRGCWIDAGRPVDSTRIASLAAHSGVVDYVPGDLTITVRSGTTLGEIADITGAEGQWLPLDPFGSREGTIGATIATGSFGPLAHSFGRARDLVLGVEFVTGEAKAVRGGGRVVKNVAGFDLVRLITGSWGTLGIVTEATLRLYSKPSHTVTLSLGAPDGVTALSQRITSVLTAPGIAFAVEMVDAGIATKLGLSAKLQILIRLGGNAAAVAAQRAAIESLGGAHEVNPAVWDKLREIEESAHDDWESAAGPIVVRISSLPQRVAQLWTDARNAVTGIDGAMMHATPSLGIVRCILPASTPMLFLERLAEASPGATIIYERLPSHLWPLLSPSVVTDRISQGIKRAFDPSNILNPGILGSAS
jgi:glycolate oxidase FAD binding subunit